MLWLFPLTYAVHIAEELWAGEGFPAWVARVVGAPMPVGSFLTLNAIGLTLMTIGVVLARRGSPFGWIPVTLAGIVTINACAHAMATLALGVYSPGLVSGLMLWAPLGVYTLRRTHRELSTRSWTGGLIVAVAVHALVTLLAAGAARG